MGVVDLDRVRAALGVLDDLAAAGFTGRLLTPADLEALEREEVSVKGTSVRLTGAQAAELERLAEVLTRTRPDLVALARGEALTPYAVLRLAIDRGLRALAADTAAPGGGA